METANLRLEPRVREILGLAVRRNTHGYLAALETVAEAGESEALDVIKLTAAIGVKALSNIHYGKMPSMERIQFLATEFVGMNAWGEFQIPVVEDILKTLASQAPGSSTFPSEDVLWTFFVVVAWLLGAFVPEDKPWWEVLDETLNALVVDSKRL